MIQQEEQGFQGVEGQPGFAGRQRSRRKLSQKAAKETKGGPGISGMIRMLGRRGGGGVTANRRPGCMPACELTDAAEADIQAIARQAFSNWGIERARWHETLPGTQLRTTGRRRAQSTYTMKYNRRHEVFGHLFQGRYKAVVVDAKHPQYLQPTRRMMTLLGLLLLTAPL